MKSKMGVGKTESLYNVLNSSDFQGVSLGPVGSIESHVNSLEMQAHSFSFRLLGPNTQGFHKPSR